MVHSVAGPRHPPDTVLHPLASIADAFGMSDQFGKCRLSGKAGMIGTVGSTQAAEFANHRPNDRKYRHSMTLRAFLTVKSLRSIRRDLPLQIGANRAIAVIPRRT
jgi:hypothetical protein